MEPRNTPNLLRRDLVRCLPLVAAFAVAGCGDASDEREVVLEARDIGDPTAGKDLFTAKRCDTCHSYEGQGGEDAPPLDFMRGRLTARDLADMMGTLWNHIPHMLPAFEAEGVSYPTFTPEEMANLLAFLHGGSDAAASDPNGAPAGHEGGEDIPASAIGDPARGVAIFEEKKCNECHSYGGMGGTDAPPFDYMAGHLSAKEIAMMSGKVWNSFPLMFDHFMEEGLEVPTFAEGEAADLVAYLHGGLEGAP